MRRWLMVLSIVACTFLFYATPVFTNTVPVHPDEFYWIGTGRIIPLLYMRDTKHPFWNEYYGYANFNGAKLLYGIGLTLLGHTDYQQFNLPPYTYYKFAPYEGNLFPRDHPLYSMLRDGRLISVLFAALAAGAMFVWAQSLLQSRFGAGVATMVFVLHPITAEVATHAFADSFYIFFIAVLLLIMHRFLVERLKRLAWWWPAVLGATLAWIVSIKLNGVLFLFPILLAFIFKAEAWVTSRQQRVRHLFGMLTGLTLSCIVTFTLLHPNLFFFPERGVATIIADRIRVTRVHMAYFDGYDPSHVRRSVPSRIASMSERLFLWPWATPVVIGGFGIMLRRAGNAFERMVLQHFTISAFAITWGVLTYVVFDEGRYFLPILPYAAVAVGETMRAAPAFLRRHLL